MTKKREGNTDGKTRFKCKNNRLRLVFKDSNIFHFLFNYLLHFCPNNNRGNRPVHFAHNVQITNKIITFVPNNLSIIVVDLM